MNPALSFYMPPSQNNTVLVIFKKIQLYKLSFSKPNKVSPPCNSYTPSRGHTVELYSLIQYS